jgi:hypothetical protein
VNARIGLKSAPFAASEVPPPDIGQTRGVALTVHWVRT